MAQYRRFSVILLLLVMIATGIACNVASDVTTPTATALLLSATAVPTQTATAVPLLKLRVMTYDIACDGMSNSDVYLNCMETSVSPNSAYAPVEIDSNRSKGFDDLVAYVREMNPDVLTLEEAVSWEKGDPPIAEVFAKAVAMPHYFLAEDVGGSHNAIFSKLPILETETMGKDILSSPIARASIQTPDGERLNLFAVHFDQASMENRRCEINFLTERLEAYQNQLSLLMGNFNASDDAPELTWLHQLGWQQAQSSAMVRFDQTEASFDHIYLAGSNNWQKANLCPSDRNTCPEKPQISNHPPVTAIILLYDHLKAEEKVHEILPLLLPIDEKIWFLNKSISEQEGYRGLPTCGLQPWEANTKQVDFSRNAEYFRIPAGDFEWDGGVKRKKSFSEGQGASIYFRFDPGSEYKVKFSNGSWGDTGYRQFGIYSINDEFFVETWIGNHRSTTSQIFSAEPGEMLSLTLALENDGGYILILQNLTAKGCTVIFPQTNIKDQSCNYTYHQISATDWYRDNWRYSISVNTGSIEIQSYTSFRFDTIKVNPLIK